VDLERERDLLRQSHEQLRFELQLLKRRIFVAKAERVDTTQLELEFAEKLAALEAMADTLGVGAETAAEEDASPEQDSPKPSKGPRAKPKGRRNLFRLALEEARIELDDPLFEALVKDGKAEHIGFEESAKLAWQRAGLRRLVTARRKYRVLDSAGESIVETAPTPPEALPRCLAAPSMLAHVAVEKFCDGMPLARIEDRLGRDGVPVDRGTLSRWMEALGGTFGSTVVHAMRDEAMRTAFCIATDATGVAVQPERRPERKRQEARRAHYLVQIADRDHIFFEFMPRETSAAIKERFEGFAGYVQADAKSVFDALFLPPEDGALDDDSTPTEVGCWAHARRKFWEVTMAKSAVAREGLARIGRIFAIDETWRDKSPNEIRNLRDKQLRPHIQAFLAWVDAEYERVRDQRGPLRSALGYAVRQRGPLTRFLDDGRLALDNNRSERELRRIAVGRKAWLFVGSDDHGTATGHLFTMVASARLHGLDPELYLRDLIRVLPHWPRQRFLELSPKYWLRTRSRLIASQLVRELGPLEVPPLATEEQAPAG
jgi:transposase